jgi:hypothetical protein
MMMLIVSVTLVTVLAMMAVAVATIVATRQDVLQPATANPFGPGSANPSDDTIGSEQAVIQTVLMPQHEWQVATLSNLSQVEDLLDSLEAHGIAHREVHTLGDNVFAVRWK